MVSMHELARRRKRVDNLHTYANTTAQNVNIHIAGALADMERTRPYARGAMDILVHLAEANRGNLPSHPLLESRDTIQRIGVLTITTNDGLSGKFVENSVKTAVSVCDKQKNTPSLWWLVGSKGSPMVRKYIERAPKGSDIAGVFSAQTSEDIPRTAQMLSGLLMQAYMYGDVDAVFIQYTNFINRLTQQPRVRMLLPLDPFSPKIQEIFELDTMELRPDRRTVYTPYTIEPSHEGLLEEILPRFFNAVIMQAMYESRASELAYRAVTSQNAARQAKEIGIEIKRDINKVRQEGITTEMLDIIGGVEALKDDRK